MHKQVLVLLAVGHLAVTTAIEIPKGVARIAENYVADSAAENGFLMARKVFGLGDDIRSNEIKVGTPMPVYTLDMGVVEARGVDVPIGEAITPTSLWYLPVRAKGTYIYEVEVAFTRGNWRTIGLGELKPGNLWQKFRSAYPESSGGDPILIRHGNTRLLHFPGKGTRSLFHVKPWYDEAKVREYYRDDPLGSNTSRNVASLDDTREVLGYLLQSWVRNRAKREKMMRKNSGGADPESTGGAQ